MTVPLCPYLASYQIPGHLIGEISITQNRRSKIIISLQGYSKERMDFSDADEETFLPSEDILEEYTVSDAVMSAESDVEEENGNEEPEEIEEEKGAEDPSRHGIHPSALFSGIQDEAYTADLQPGKDILLAGGGDDRAYLYEFGTMTLLEEFSSFGDSIIDVQFCPSNPKRYLLAAMNGKIIVGEVGSEVRGEADGPEELSWCRWHPRAPAILGGSGDGLLWIWQVKFTAQAIAIECMHVLGGHTGNITTHAFSRCLGEEGKLVVTGDEQGGVLVWRLRDGASVVKYHMPAMATFIACHPTAEVAVVGMEDGRYSVISLSSMSIINRGAIGEVSIEAILFMPTMLLLSDMDGKISALDSNSFALRWEKRLEAGVTRIVSVENLVLVGLANGAILGMDARDGTEKARWMGSTDGSCAVNELRLEGGRFIAAFDDGNVQVYTL